MSRALYLLLLFASFVNPARALADPIRVDPRTVEKHLQEARQRAAVPVTAAEILDRRFSDVRLKATELETRAAWLSDRIVIDWRTFAAAGIGRSYPVTLDRHDVTPAQLLEDVLAQTGADKKGLRYEVIGELVVVSDENGLRRAGLFLEPPGASPLARVRLMAVAYDPCLGGDNPGLWLLNISLRESVDVLSKEVGVPFRVDWDSLKTAGLAPDRPVSLHPEWTSSFDGRPRHH